MSCGAPELSDHERLRRLLRGRLHTQPEPLSLIGAVTIPAASLWNGAKCWIEALRRAELQPGDTVVLHPGHQVALVQVLLAGLWCGLHVELVPPRFEQGSPNAGAVVVDLRAKQGLAGPATPLRRPTGQTGPTGPTRTCRTPPTLAQRGERPLVVDTAGLLAAVTSPAADRFTDAVVLVAATDLALSTVVDHVLVPLLSGATAVIWPSPHDLAQHARSLIARHDPDVIVPCGAALQASGSRGEGSPPICTQ